LPLIQVASISVLLGSSVLALHRGEQWISGTHAMAYALMFIGGLLPATGGEIGVLLRRSFWQQSYVAYAVLSELTFGLHDLLASACAYHGHGSSGGGSGETESFEYFVWSRCGFVTTFVGIYVLVPSLNRELRQLFAGRVRAIVFVCSSVSEILSLNGYYLMSRALGLFYQPALVHAAEASLSQLLNLLLAYGLLHGCGIGRNSAVGSMRAKLLSFVLVTVGLIVCSFEDSAHSAKPAAHANLSLAARPVGQTDDGSPATSAATALARGPNAEFYDEYQHSFSAPVMHSLRGGNAFGRPWQKRERRRARQARHDFFFRRDEDA
jgi:hypothetical protein